MTTPCPADFLAGLKITVIRPVPVFDAPITRGASIKLDEWRKQLARNREAVLEQWGVYLDSSPTGAGKSHADVQAAQIARTSLIVMPTHDNAAEVEADVTLAGIEAKKYPGRYTEHNHAPCPRCDRDGTDIACPLCSGAGRLLMEQNCENEDADLAEQWGLCVVAAVCPTCPHKAVCHQGGYLAGLLEASKARVAIATHARAKRAGLKGMGEDREYQSLHEDCLEIFRPTFQSGETDLAAAKKVIEILLTDPWWLDWFVRGEDEKERNRRGDLYDFVHHLLNVAGAIEDQTRFAEKTQRISLPPPLPKPPGIEALLFRVAHQHKAQFTRQPLSILLAAAAGACFQVGVLVHDRKPKRNRAESDQDDRGRAGQPADEERESCAL